VLGVSLAIAIVAVGSVPALAQGRSQAGRVVTAVTRHIGARYRHGFTGPHAFDCSGLVYRSFREAGLARRIGGFSGAHGYYQRFRRMGRVSRTAPRVGDIIVYDRGGHVGIYVGRGKVVSALYSGVKRHPIRGLNIPYTAVLRVELGRSPVRPVRTRARRNMRASVRNLPLRLNPSRGSHAIRGVGRGARMFVLRTRKRPGGRVWIKVRLGDGDQGWVNRRFTRRV
jgi:cell wall-associated NlpC family hydrolase